MSRKLQWREYESNEESAATVEVAETDFSTLLRSRGFVSFFSLDRSFGFIRTGKETYYTHVTNVRGETPLCRGDLVEFVLIRDPKTPGLFRAADVQILKRHQDVAEVRPAPPGAEEQFGIVQSFDNSKHFGFISVENSTELAFVHSDNVFADPIGRRHLIPGHEVSFKAVRGTNGLKARECRDISDETSSINAKEYREMGQLLNWDLAKACGWVLRSDGEKIFLWSGHVITLGIETLAPGSWLRYAVRSRVRLDGRREWFAAAVEIFRSDYDPSIELTIEPGSAEEFFLSVDEPQSPAASVVPEKPIYSASDRKRSLRELIAAKKLVAVVPSP